MTKKLIYLYANSVKTHCACAAFVSSSGYKSPANLFHHSLLQQSSETLNPSCDANYSLFHYQTTIFVVLSHSRSSQKPSPSRRRRYHRFYVKDVDAVQLTPATHFRILRSSAFYAVPSSAKTTPVVKVGSRVVVPPPEPASGLKDGIVCRPAYTVFFFLSSNVGRYFLMAYHE